MTELTGSIYGARVAILLGTKNGAAFIDDQIRSYLSQTHKNWSLYVSDDNSTDDTVGQIVRIANENSQCPIFVRDGPGLGFCRNFMSLARDETIEADFFAFSDQDDIWYPDKLERALRYLSSISSSIPAMYCSRTELVDANRKHLGFSSQFLKAPSFQNALVQNIGGGNTMVFNVAGKKLLEATGNIAVVSHDWWTYQIITAAGGFVFFDPRPSLEYRQHSLNILGSNIGWRARLVRLKAMFAGTMRDWNDQNLRAMETLRTSFNSKNNLTLDNFSAARTSPWLPLRVFYLFKSGVYRQTFFAHLGLVLAVMIRKL